MSGPRTIDVSLEVIDAEEALRIVSALEAVVAALWRAYGDEMSERSLDRHCADAEAPQPDDQIDLPF